MKLPVGVSVLSLLLLLITVDTHALSVSRPRTTNVTIVEITTKLEAQLGENPENVDALLALAKLHCFAYAYNRTLFSVADSPQEPDRVHFMERSPFPYRWSSHVLTVTGGRITHLAQVIPLQLVPKHRLGMQSPKLCTEGTWNTGSPLQLVPKLRLGMQSPELRSEGTWNTGSRLDFHPRSRYVRTIIQPLNTNT